MDLGQFKQTFIDEVSTLLASLDNSLIELENDPGNVPHVYEAFRVMHTIKGTSGMYGFDQVMQITHELESLYDVIREKQLIVSKPLLELTFAASDHIRAVLTDQECTNSETLMHHIKIMDRMQLIKNDFELPPNKNKVEENFENLSSTYLSTWNILFYPNDEIIKRAVNLVYTFQDLFHLGEYQINNQPFQSDEQQYWSIFLVTDKSQEDIEGALMFIMDYYVLTKVAKFNIFDPNQFEKNNETVADFHADVQRKNPIEEQSMDSVVVPNESRQLPVTSNDTFQQFKKTNSLNRINVDASKLDTLMYLVSELVTAKSELLLSLQKPNLEKATDIAEKIEKLSKLFNENALSIRLVTLQELLARFKRLTRDLAKQLNKSIQFITIVEDTELDKNIIDNLSEPLLHLIRNCIDHGIETAEIRKNLDKPGTGTIQFEAVKSGNFVYLYVSDDGQGINTKTIYDKAVQKGFIEAGTNLSEKEIFDLIFLPGFSTAQTLSNVSGRGVGMDIVRRKIKEIRGEISITSTPGLRTKFAIKLQQTISIIETLLIQSGGITYAIPLEDIEACVLDLDENLINHQTNLIRIENQMIPYFNIRTSFKMSTPDQPLQNNKLVIIKRQNKKYAVVAENILGEYQAVLKPLGAAFANQKFLSGASLLGDGSIAFLLDTNKLWDEISASY